MLQPQLAPDVNHVLIANQLLEATQAASAACGPLKGRGDQYGADQLAVEAMHASLQASGLRAYVAIGEGEKDGAPMLTEGFVYGDGEPEIDIAADPLECTKRFSLGKLGSMSVLAAAPVGTIPEPHGMHYMMRIIGGPELTESMQRGDIRVDRDPTTNLLLMARALGKHPTEMTVATLNRPDRNGHIIRAARALGVRLVELDGGDLAPAMTAADGNWDRRIDVSYGSGGATEAVLASIYATIRGGNAQAMWDPRTEQQKRTAFELGELGRVIDLSEQWRESPLYFAATATTDSDIYGPNLTGSQKVGEEWLPGSSVRAFHTGNSRR